MPGKGQSHFRSFPLFTDDLDGTAGMALDNSLADGQSQAGAPLFGGEEGGKNLILNILGNPRPIVPNADFYLAAGYPGMEGKVSSLLQGFYAIADEV